MTHGGLMTIKKNLAAFAALLALTFVGGAAVADEHPFTEGQIVNVSAIRTEYGKFDDYMKYLATTWKARQEAAKKAGLKPGFLVSPLHWRTAQIQGVSGMRSASISCGHGHEVGDRRIGGRGL